MKATTTLLLTFFSTIVSTIVCADSVSLFDGKSLQGWRPVDSNNAKYWSVIDGVITASNGNQKMPTNTYLATDKNYQNFIFKCKFRLSGDHKTGLINSGIQYRSLMHRTPKPGVHKIIGYQADIGKGYWGDIYDEHRRGKLVTGNTAKLFRNFKEDDWNSYTIHCVGRNHKLYINGHLTVDYTEPSSSMPDQGVLALQLHSGGIAKMEYKDITIEELPPTPLVLEKTIAASSAKIHGRVLKVQGDMIVAWSQTSDYLEWTIPAHIKPGAYDMIIDYGCNLARQGSDMELSTASQTVKFKTIGKAKAWTFHPHQVGSLTLKPGQNKLILRCKRKQAKDWVLDLSSITFVPKG